MTKSKEIADACMATVNCMLLVPGVDMAEVAAHTLAQEAEIDRLEQAEEASKEVFGQIVDQKKELEKRLSDVVGTIQAQQSVIAAMRAERDQARDALRMAVEALEFFSRGIKGGHIKCASYIDFDPDAERLEIKSPVTRLDDAIKQAKEAL